MADRPLGGPIVRPKWVVLTLLLTLAFVFWDHNYYEAWKKSLKERSNCEYDTDDAVKRVKELSAGMRAEVFGQHLAIQVVTRALYAHLKERNPRKALVLSFHGSIGSGKTLVSQLIASHLFEGGFDSPFVHAFIGPKHFILDPGKLAENQANLSKRLEGAREKCGRALFIFDEVDKMPPEIFDVLVPYIDHRKSIDGVDYRGLTFIFLSNTGGMTIRKVTAELLEGKKREDIVYEDFSQLIAKNAFSEQGGLAKSDMIWKNLIDYYVPFLPLEKEHVIACAKKDIMERKVLFIPPEKIAEKVVYRTAVWDRSFADDGCKSVSTLVNFYVQEEDLELTENEKSEL